MTNFSITAAAVRTTQRWLTSIFVRKSPHISSDLGRLCQLVARWCGRQDYQRHLWERAVPLGRHFWTDAVKYTDGTSIDRKSRKKQVSVSYTCVVLRSLILYFLRGGDNSRDISGRNFGFHLVTLNSKKNARRPPTFQAFCSFSHHSLKLKFRVFR